METVKSGFDVRIMVPILRSKLVSLSVPCTSEEVCLLAAGGSCLASIPGGSKRENPLLF